MRTRSSDRVNVSRGFQCSTTSRGPYRPRSSRQQKMKGLSRKRGHINPDTSLIWKRSKGQEDLPAEHELTGKLGSRWQRIGIPSCNPKRGSVYQVGQSFSSLMREIQRGNVTALPEEFIHSLQEDRSGCELVRSVSDLVRREGFAFYSADLRLCLNLLDVEQKPDKVICDVIIFTHTLLPVVLTIVKGDYQHDVTKYSYSLSRELTYTMRDYTDEGFNIFDAVVDIDKVTTSYLKDVVYSVGADCRRNLPIERLCMSRERCLSLTQALLAQGFTSSVNENLETQITQNLTRLENSEAGAPEIQTSLPRGSERMFDIDDVHLLTPDQFRFLNMCINGGQMWLVSSPRGTGKIRFGLETARRLSLQGRTLVLCESDQLRSKIKYSRNMAVVTRPELQVNPGICQEYDNFVVVKAEQLEFQCGRELIFDWHHNLEQAISQNGGKLVIVYDKRDDPDLEDCDIRLLQSRLNELRTCLIPEDIVLELLSKKVLSVADLILVKKRRTREEMNEELLRSLLKTSRRGYDIFLRAMRKTRQGHLADLLELGTDPVTTLMTADRKQLLLSSRGYLTESMIPFAVLNRLYRKEVFTVSDVSRILAEESINRINTLLLDYLSGKPDHDFDLFLESLDKTCQGDLKDSIVTGNFRLERSVTGDEDEEKTRATGEMLAEKVDVDDLLLELESSNLLHKDDIRYIRLGNNLGKAFPERGSSEAHSSKEVPSAHRVVERLFALLSRKFTSPCETIVECLRSSGQYEAVQYLQDLQGASASHHMEVEDSVSSYRTLDVKFIDTKAFQAVLDRLMDPSEVFIVLTGAPGEGKTTAALQAMRHLGLQMRKLIIKTPEEFDQKVTMETPTTVVLDDVFGIVEVNESAVRQWVPILQRVKKYSESRTGPSINLIITSRNHVWRAAESLVVLSEIIPVSSVIDFTVLVPLVRAEKKRMLDSHLDKYGIDLDNTLVERIAETHGTLGFPLCCKLFAAEQMFQDNPVDFFTHPLNYIVKRLLSSCEDPSNLTLIKQVVMSKGQLDVKKAEVGSINDKSVANMKNYVFQEGNILYFPHKSIADAASYVMATKFSIDYLGECSLQFLYERVREKPSRGESSDEGIQIHVNQKDLQSLIHRLANEMSAGNLALACSHPALSARRSVVKLFSQFKDLRKTVNLKDKKHGGSFLYWATWNNSENLCKETLDVVENLPDCDISEAVLGCCLSGNTNALKELLKRTDLKTVRACGIKYLPKISTRQQLVANESVRVIEISGGRMAQLACRYSKIEIVEVLMGHGLDLNERDSNGETCLLAASLGDNPSAVSFLLQHNVEWSEDNDGHSPLHLAIEKENADVLKVLLEHPAAKDFLNKTDTDGQSPLHLACLKKSPEMVELLLQQDANVDVTDSCGWTPLHYVSWIGNRKIVEILTRLGADVNLACREGSSRQRPAAKLKGHYRRTETEGMTALHLACHQGHVGIVKKLADVKGINVNIKDVFGKSALYIASKRGHSHLVKVLLEHHADTSLATLDSRTAVYAASKKGHNQVIELLCRNGADVNTGTRSQRKRNPLYAASRKGYVTAVNTLLMHGANVNFQDLEGNTSLHVACAVGNTDVVKCLLKWGADIMSRNNSKLTPLHEAVAVPNANPDVIDYLLLANANVNAVDDRNWTPLHLASLCGTGDIVKTLLLWKADVHARDITDMTALGYASATGKVDNVNVLLKHQANIDKVCLFLAVSYGHADVVDVLLREKLSLREVEDMYELAKQREHQRVIDVVSRYRQTTGASS